MKLVTYECKWYASPYCYDSLGKATDSVDEIHRIIFLHPSSRQSYEGEVDSTKIDDEKAEKSPLEADLTLSYFKNAAPIILEWLRRHRDIINKDYFAKDHQEIKK